MSQKRFVCESVFTVVLSSGSEGEDEPQGHELAMEAVFKKLKGCRCGRSEGLHRQAERQQAFILEERRRLESAYEKIRERERVLREAMQAVNVIIEKTN